MAITGTFRKADGGEQIIEYTITEGRVDCSGDGLEELFISAGEPVTALDCSINELSTLSIPNSCEYVNCSENNLSKLTIPAACNEVHCEDNNIRLVTKPDNCILYCRGNPMTRVI